MQTFQHSRIGKMIDYLTIIYKNYDLLDLQLDNFKKRFSKKDYRLIVVDNTPDFEKREIQRSQEIDVIINLESVPTFDGISHGGAIDAGLKYCESKVVCIFDSDFFFLNSNINDYISDKFEKGYLAVGCEWNDGDGTKSWFEKMPSKFEDIPCAFGSFYDLNLAKSDSWIITPEELQQNIPSGFVEVGWRIRKNILDNKIKTFSWKTNSDHYGDCFFKDENDIIMGIHYVAGSHRRWSHETYSEIKKIISEEY